MYLGAILLLLLNQDFSSRVQKLNTQQVSMLLILDVCVYFILKCHQRHLCLLTPNINIWWTQASHLDIHDVTQTRFRPARLQLHYRCSGNTLSHYFEVFVLF